MKIYKLAHRGDTTIYPDNSYDSFVSAFDKYNWDGIETDIRLTKDNQLICFHDEIIDNITNYTGLVKDYVFADLKNMKLKNRNGIVMDQYIILLEELILLSCKYNKIINLEIKIDPLEYDINETVLRIKKLLEQYISHNKNIMKNTILSSFYHHYYEPAKFNQLYFAHIIDNKELLYGHVPKIVSKTIKLDEVDIKQFNIIGLYTLGQWKNNDLHLNIHNLSIEIRDNIFDIH
jgi:glycerophosphoryl diester phosphodiesterase